MDFSWPFNSNSELKKSTAESTVLPSDYSSLAGASKEIIAVRLGILSDPPTLILIYDCEATGRRKRRKRRIPLRNFNDRANVVKTVFGLRKRHSDYLNSISTVTLEKMVRVIQEIQKGLNIDEAVVKVHQEYEINPNQDLNKLSTIDLSRKKEIMDESFVKTLIKPNDHNYVYDKEIEFERLQVSENAWDDLEEDVLAKMTVTTTVVKLKKLESNPIENESQSEVNDRDDKSNMTCTDPTTPDNEADVTNNGNTETRSTLNFNNVENNEYEQPSSIYDDKQFDDESFW